MVDDLEESVIAFLNKDGGNIYIGIDDNGNIIGLKNDYSNIPEARLEEIKNYYLMKNKKLQETSLLKTGNKHL